MLIVRQAHTSATGEPFFNNRHIQGANGLALALHCMMHLQVVHTSLGKEHSWNENQSTAACTCRLKHIYLCKTLLSKVTYK